MPGITAAYIVDRVKRKYGRMTSELREALLGDINEWVAMACRRWHFWFMDIEPGAQGFQYFQSGPIDTTTPASFLQPGNFPFSGSRFYDQNWLATNTGQMSYMYAIPLDTAVNASDSFAPDRTKIQWTFAEIRKLHQVIYYSTGGAPRAEIEVLNPEDFMNRGQFETTGVPRFCTFKTLPNGASIISFTPVPNGILLIAISSRLAKLPPLDTPRSFNFFSMYYPRVMILAGLIEAAKYFGEGTELQMYKEELYGAKYLQLDDQNFVPGGELGSIIQETRDRMGSRHLTARCYDSAKYAFGRRNTYRTPVVGGWYWGSPP